MASSLSSLSSRAIISRIIEELDAPPVDWVSKVSTPPLPSNTLTETYAGLGAVPPLKVMDNANPVYGDLRGYTLQITNAAYQTGFRVNVDDVRREKTGQVDQKIVDLGARYNEHWDKLVTAMIIANGNGYDGVAFFASTHASSGSNQTNLTAATGTSPTAAQMEAGLLAGLTTLYSLKDDQGEPINQSKKLFIAMFPVAHMASLYGALRLTGLAQTGGPQPSVIATLEGVQIVPVVNPRLSTANVGYLMAAGGRSFIRQQETGPEITAIAEGSEHAKKHREHLYGVATVRGAGLGAWQSATKITFS